MFKPFKSVLHRPALRVASVCLAMLGGAVQANAVEITAEYRASVDRNEFRNTTPSSGYCVDYGCEGDLFSISLPVTYDRTVKSGLPPIPQRWSLKTPGETTVNVVSDRGDTAPLKLQITHVAQQLREGGTPLEDTNNPAGHYSAGGGCSWVTGQIWEQAPSRAGFVWQVNDPRSPSLCYPTSTYADDQNDVTPFANDLSIGYKLILPRPHTMPTGTYYGSVTFSVGEVGDFSLGSNVTNLSTNSVTLNFTVTVHHELQVQFPANSESVLIEPVNGWQKWLDTGIPPTDIRGSLPFRLTTSGPFSVVMNCGEQGIGEACVMRNQRSSEPVNFGARLYPPKGLEVEGNPGVEAPWRDTLIHGKPLQYRTRGFMSSVLGKVEFYTSWTEAAKLAQSPGDKWVGLVTLVFDATI